MSKDLIHWFKYHIGDMEFAFRYLGTEAEGIAHRLCRTYYRREKDIPSDDRTIAKLAKVSVKEYLAVKHELEDVIDVSGPVLRIRLLDELMEQAIRSTERRSIAGKKGAAARWGKKSEGGNDE